MNSIKNLFVAVGVALLLLCSLMIGVAAPAAAADTAGESSPGGEPAVGFVAYGSAVNTDQEGADPSLAIEPGGGGPWVAFRSGAQILVSKAVTSGGAVAWQQQGSALTIPDATAADKPELAFAGVGKPWVAWDTLGGSGPQVHVAAWDGAVWVTWELLARDPQQGASWPDVAVGQLAGDAQPLPWVAWSESLPRLLASQIVAARAISDVTAPGGVRWEAVGQPLLHSDATLPVYPHLAFVGDTPWLTWTEFGQAGTDSLYAARAVADSGSPSGYRWELVGKQTACLTSPNSTICALSTQGSLGRIVAGHWSGEMGDTPWIAFVEDPIDSPRTVRVLRLDVGEPADPSDDRFIPVGADANTNCLLSGGITAGNAGEADISFVGTVPHIAWVETQPAGAAMRSVLVVCHLIDLRLGQERWTLDTTTGLNRTQDGRPANPSMASDGVTPYVAWQEGSAPSSVFVAHRQPAGPAWGSNRPPFIRVISGTFRSLLNTSIASLPAESVAATEPAAPDASIDLGPVAITSTCNHAEGWEHIQEIQFKLARDGQTIFLGKYVAAEEKVYVEDPSQSGVFLGGETVGSGAPIETAFVELLPAAMESVQHGPGSPTREIKWVLSFKEPTHRQGYTQYLNIVYDGGQSTGFYVTGSVYVGTQLFLPHIQS